jgi:N-glycosidase YbiA
MIAGFFGEFRWLSNFVSVRVEFDGVVYPLVEHAYQAAKTVDKADRVVFEDVGLLAKDAKRLGKKLEVRPNWEKARPCVMLALVRQKFMQEPFRTLLIKTGGGKSLG